MERRHVHSRVRWARWCAWASYRYSSACRSASGAAAPEPAIQATAGAVSIVFGLVLMYRIGVIEGLFWLTRHGLVQDIADPSALLNM